MPEENVITPEAGQVPTENTGDQIAAALEAQTPQKPGTVTLTAEEYVALKALLTSRNETSEPQQEDAQEEDIEEEQAPDKLAKDDEDGEDGEDEQPEQEELTLEEHNEKLQKQVEELTSQIAQQKLTLTLYTHAEKAGINPVAAMESTYVAGQLAKVDTADPKAVVKLLRDIVAERPYLAIAKAPKSSGVPHTTPGGAGNKPKARTLEEALGKYYSE